MCELIEIIACNLLEMYKNLFLHVGTCIIAIKLFPDASIVISQLLSNRRDFFTIYRRKYFRFVERLIRSTYEVGTHPSGNAFFYFLYRMPYIGYLTVLSRCKLLLARTNSVVPIPVDRPEMNSVFGYQLVGIYPFE